jgi:RNA polymerase sigma factor (sigma-70 family)
MSRSTIDNVLHYIHQLVDRHGSRESSDAQLLTQFVTQHDEGAFEALVRRHGPMVYGVCRRMLFDANDIEDAFQATFLVLVRKAGSLSRPDSLAGWLHGVASRIAGKARQDRLKRLPGNLDNDPPAKEETMDEVLHRELSAALDEEIARLPTPYQMPFVLCHLAGRSNEEAAVELGCPTGTIYSRLARARKILEERLSRRGLSTAGGILAGALATTAAPAAVPIALLQRTVSSGTLLAAGTTLGTGLASTQTLSFVEATLQAMFISKVKSIACVVAILLAAGATLGVTSYKVFGKGQTQPALAAAGEAAPPDKPAPDPNEKLRDEVKALQDRLKAIQERQQLEAEVKKLRAQLDEIEGKPSEKLPGVTYQGKTVEHWLKQLRDAEPSTRLQALRAMTAIGDELGDDAPRVATAITAVLKPDSVNPLLLDMPLAESAKASPLGASVQPEMVQLQAIYALKAIGPAAKVALPKLVAFQLDETNSRQKILEIAAKAGTAGLDPSAPDDPETELLPSTIRSVDPDGKQAIPMLIAAIAKVKIRKPAEGVPNTDPGHRVCVNALDALATYQEKAAPATLPLVNLLRIDDSDIRYHAYLALRQIGDAGKAAAVPALTVLAKDKDAETAKAAAGVFHDIFPEEAQKADVPMTPPPNASGLPGA